MTANEKVKDYASMTDEQLKLEVAERLGLKVVHVTEDGDDSPCFDKFRDWLWDYVVLPNGDCSEIGDYANDLNEAAALDFGAWDLSITRLASGKVRVIADTEGERNVVIVEGTANMARAISEAWLMYKDAQS